MLVLWLFVLLCPFRIPVVSRAERLTASDTTASAEGLVRRARKVEHANTERPDGPEMSAKTKEMKAVKTELTAEKKELAAVKNEVAKEKGALKAEKKAVAAEREVLKVEKSLDNTEMQRAARALREIYKYLYTNHEYSGTQGDLSNLLKNCRLKAQESGNDEWNESQN